MERKAMVFWGKSAKNLDESRFTPLSALRKSFQFASKITLQVFLPSTIGTNEKLSYSSWITVPPSDLVNLSIR